MTGKPERTMEIRPGGPGGPNSTGARPRRQERDVSLEDIQAVIDSARTRGVASLERYVRSHLPEASEGEVEDAVDLAVEIIETVPILLARAAQEAEARNLQPVVNPVLAHAEAYFLQPVDLIPEMTQGLAGLLDDTYLVLRILQNLQRGPEPLLEEDLAYPTRFIRRLVGEDVGKKLDRASLAAMQEVQDTLNRFWEESAHTA